MPSKFRSRHPNLRVVAVSLALIVAHVNYVVRAAHDGNQNNMDKETMNSGPFREPGDLPVAAMTGFGTNKLFEYITEVAIQVLRDNLTTANLPEINGHSSTVLGTVHFTLDNLVVQDVDINDTGSSIAPQDDGNIHVSIQGLFIDVIGDFKLKSWLGTSSGQFEVNAVVNLFAATMVTRSAAGHAFVVVPNEAQVSFDKFDASFSKSLTAKLLNLVMRMAKPTVQRHLEDKLSKVVSETLPRKANRVLAEQPGIIEVMGLDLNVSLSADPQVTSSAWLQHNWALFQSPNASCPFLSVMQDLPVPPNPAMLYMQVDQSVANCFTWELYQEDALETILTQATLPEANFLHTGAWVLPIPQLPIKYPHKNMSVDVFAIEAPVTNVSAAAGLSVHVHVQLDFHVDSEDPDAPLGDELFQLELVGTLHPTVLELQPAPEVGDKRYKVHVQLEVEHGSLKVGVVSSEVGYIGVHRLQLVSRIATAIVQHRLNAKLQQRTFLLPDPPHVHLVDPSISLVDAAFLVSTSLQYSGSDAYMDFIGLPHRQPLLA